MMNDIYIGSWANVSEENGTSLDLSKCGASSTVIFADNDECFGEFCENSNYYSMTWGYAATTHGEYEIRNPNTISIMINFKKHSNVKLTIDCPNLMRLVVDNCNELIMSESTKPRNLELINCSGKINIPENIDENYVHEYYDGSYKNSLYVNQFKLKIRERFIQKP